MELQKYDGNIHPDEWINDLQTYFNIKPSSKDIIIAISLVDPTIKLPTDINSFEKLRNALKEDISFTVFKNTNKRKLQLLKYIPERKDGDTSKFVSTFRKLCYNGEINDIEEQKKYLFKSVHISKFNYISNEFHVKMKNVSSINELIKEFEDIIVGESNLIIKDSVIALKHVATGKYLSSIKGLHYTTGSKKQLIFAGCSDLNPNSLWKIWFNEDLADTFTSFTLFHIKVEWYLGINISNHLGHYHKSPSTNHTEVSFDGSENRWNFKHSKLENHQGYLKSNDTINLSIKKQWDNNGLTYDGPVEFLRSHDIQFTIGNDTFQEVFCHNERLGGNDEWCIELIEEGNCAA